MLVSKSLVDLIERGAEELTRRWMTIVRTHPGTPTYHAFDEQQLYDRAFSVYSQLGKWLSRSTTKEHIAAHYTALGARRFAEGFGLSEVIHALIVTRRLLWFKVQENGLLDSALDLNLALSLNNQVILFFDRAVFYAATGYEQAQRAARK